MWHLPGCVHILTLSSLSTEPTPVLFRRSDSCDSVQTVLPILLYCQCGIYLTLHILTLSSLSTEPTPVLFRRSDSCDSVQTAPCCTVNVVSTWLCSYPNSQFSIHRAHPGAVQTVWQLWFSADRAAHPAVLSMWYLPGCVHILTLSSLSTEPTPVLFRRSDSCDSVQTVLPILLYCQCGIYLAVFIS